ncbi:MAG: class I SAM-dependent methyltransferase [Proteobacteria bacterium]|nr:class I SAM-dependent methyltransferase [Pseudomonadota bacterium]
MTIPFDINKNGNTPITNELSRQVDVDTDGYMPLEGLSIDSSNRARGVWYHPTPMRLIKGALEHLDIDPADYTFVDFGAGKGRVAMLAAEHGFRRVIGVEFAAEIHQIATRNLERLRARHAGLDRVEFLCMDAADFVPPPEPTVFYLFDPFDDVVLGRVVSNIQSSLARHPRPVLFVYMHPVHAHVFDELGVPRDQVHLVRLSLRDVPEMVLPHLGTSDPARLSDFFRVILQLDIAFPVRRLQRVIRSIGRSLGRRQRGPNSG